MFCVRCQNEVYYCTCPDIEERLASLRKDIVMAWCERCDNHIDRCTCPDVGEP